MCESIVLCNIPHMFSSLFCLGQNKIRQCCVNMSVFYISQVLLSSIVFLIFSSMLMLQIELAFVDAILPHATSLSFTHFASYQPYTFLPISAIHPPHLPSPNLSWPDLPNSTCPCQPLTHPASFTHLASLVCSVSHSSYNENSKQCSFKCPSHHA